MQVLMSLLVSVCMHVSVAVCVRAHEEGFPFCPVVALEFQYCYVLFDLYPWEFCVQMFVCVRGYNYMFLDN